MIHDDAAAGGRDDTEQVGDAPIDRSRAARGVDRFQRAMFRLHAWCFVSFNTVLVSMWAWGGGHEFWPAVSIIPGGALLAWHRKGSLAASRKLRRAPSRRAIAA